MTPYVAEFISTITNLAYIFYAIRYAYAHSWDLPATALTLVGICSFAFHATLHQESQFADDLSMMVLAASFLIPAWTARTKSQSTRDLLSGVIVIGVSAVALAYVRTGDITFHTYTFAVLIWLGVPRTIYLVQTAKPAKGAQSEKGWRTKQMSGLIYAGTLVAVGFGLWNVDLEMCFKLRAFRDQIGLPWAWLFELHGWWHILTAAGAYEYMKVLAAATSV